MTELPKRPIRIGGVSGGFSDRIFAMSRMAASGAVDVLVGDWLAEMTMAEHGAQKARRLGNTSAGTDDMPTSIEELAATAQFSTNFVDCFKPAIPSIQKHGIKVAVNAGSCDAEILARLVQKLCDDAGYNMRVAWISGDDVTDRVKTMLSNGERFQSLNRGKEAYLDDWGFDLVNAQAYLGGMGIAQALRNGADIVICGRVADAAPTIGAAAWWHGWESTQFDELAGSLIAGHLIECSGYVTGANFSGFKTVLAQGKHLNIGFPIAEVDSCGVVVVTKEKETGGEVSVATVTSQLVYEIQGPLYYNADVTADIEDAKIDLIGPDRVRVHNIKGLPPPPTTKVGITAPAGWQAEYHIYFVGLDIPEKVRWTEEQIRESIGDQIGKYSMLKFHLNGSSPTDAANQDEATVDLRVFAQSRDAEVMDPSNPRGFLRTVMVCTLESAPGASLGNDLRLGFPKPFYEFYVTLLPQSEIHQEVHYLFDSRTPTTVPTPILTRTYPRQQRSYETANPVPLEAFGPTVRVPLGYIVYGRGGDKASDCNNGFFVRGQEEWDWLRSYLTVPKIIELLGAEYKGKPIDRFELPHIHCVHFLLHDHLDRGYNACSTYDTLGKNTIEWIRSKVVEIPTKFLFRGKL